MSPPSSPPAHPPRVRLLHETNPAKYFPALLRLHEEGRIEITGMHRTSVLREWLRAGLKDRTPLMRRTKHALGDLWVRLNLLRIRGEVIILGFAPWDPRILWYRGLARRNRLIYHSSWPDWRLGHTPRRPVFARWIRRIWQRFLHHPNVQSVAILPEVAGSIDTEMGARATVIPHAVAEAFFQTPPLRNAGPLRLLFVGEVSAKKGIPQILRLLESFDAAELSLSVIGRGPLEDTLPERVHHHGAITDRRELAHLMAAHDVLICLSQRTETWQELFGLVIAEASAAGCAVIASDHLGPRAILGETGGLVDERDTDAVDALLRSFIADPQTCRALAQRQRARIADYALPCVADRWAQLIGAPCDV